MSFPKKKEKKKKDTIVALTKLAFLTLYAARRIPICIIIVRGLKRSRYFPFPLVLFSFFPFFPPPLINFIRLNGRLSFPGIRETTTLRWSEKSYTANEYYNKFHG